MEAATEMPTVGLPPGLRHLTDKQIAREQQFIEL